MLFLSAIKRIMLFNDYIKFRKERVLPFLNKEHKIKYDNIEKFNVFEKDINYFTLILPGLGSLKDAEFVFYLKDGRIEKETIRGNRNKVKELQRLIIKKIS